MRVKDETKQYAIRRVTLAIVQEKGLAGVKMANIAKKIGISPSTLYVYHRNKEKLLVALFLDIFNEKLEFAKKEVIGDLPFNLKLKKKWLSSINFSINSADELNFMEQMRRSPYYEQIFNKIKSEKHFFFQDLFEEGKSQKAIKDIDNEILMSVYMGSIKQTAELITKKHIRNNRNDLDLMFSLFWHAIRG